MEMVQHGVESLMYLMTESSKYMVTYSHSDQLKVGKLPNFLFSLSMCDFKEKTIQTYVNSNI